MNFIKNFIQEEDGVTAIEYALIASMIAGVVYAGASTMGGNIKDMFTNLAAKVKTTFA